jgi:SAM-dependent methyltransferase
MNGETRRFFETADVAQMDAVEISGLDWAEFGWNSYVHLDYPNFDICRHGGMPNSCDVVIAEQVFEHLPAPNRALRHIFEMLRPHGLFLITTPFLIKVHPTPNDYWRWTVEGMKLMLEESQFKVVLCNSWGNRACVTANFDAWPDYREGMSLENEADFPLVVWAVGQK